MAKRFMDTEMWRQEWFSALQNNQQLLWIYLCLNCDVAGIWERNYRIASFELNQQISDASFECFGDRIRFISNDRLWIPGFIKFQQGTLSSKNNIHKSIITRLIKNDIDPKTIVGMQLIKKRDEFFSFIESIDIINKQEGLPRPWEGPPQDLPRCYSNSNSNSNSNTSLKGELTDLKDQISACLQEWVATLKHFGINRPVAAIDKRTIFTLIKQHGSELTSSAIIGMRHEAGSNSFDPSKHVSISRLLDTSRFEKMMNLGSNKKLNKATEEDESSPEWKKKREESKKRKLEIYHDS